MHNLNHLHKLFIFSAQRAAQVILILFQTSTTVHSHKIMDTSHGGQVHHQTFPRLAQPACDQADFLQPMPDSFSAVVQPFPARQRDPIDLVCDFIY